MTLSWSMDKIGPICRTVEDCAIVFNAIYGPDGIDQTLYDAPFNYDSRIKLKKLRIGYLKGDFDKEKGERKENDEATLQKMRALGAQLISIELPDYPVGNIRFVLSTEGAAPGFDPSAGDTALRGEWNRGSYRIRIAARQNAARLLVGSRTVT